MPLCHRNEGCYPPRKPRFHPSVRCLSTSERRVGEGRFFFVSPPLSSFPLILFCLAACAALACNCTGGVLALCVQCFVGTSAFRRPPQMVPAWVASRWLRDGKKRGGKGTETGRFLHRLPPFAFESRARRVPSNRVVAVRGRAQTVPAANETNAEQKRNL